LLNEVSRLPTAIAGHNDWCAATHCSQASNFAIKVLSYLDKPQKAADKRGKPM